MLYAGDLLRQPRRVAWAPADILATPVVAALMAVPLLATGMVITRIFLHSGTAAAASGFGLRPIVGLCVLYGSLFAATILLTVGKYRVPWAALWLRPVRWSAYPALIPVLVAVNLVCGALEWLLWPLAGHGTQLANPQATDLLTSFPISWGGLAGALLVVAVVAPIVEETYFRGMIYGLLRERHGVGPAIAVSALIFAAAHVFVFGRYIVLAFPELCVLGVALAAVTEQSRSLYPAILLHAVNNALVVIALFWSVAATGLPLTS